MPEDVLVAQPDGAYHLRLNQTALVKEVTTASGADEPLVVPVVAEELTSADLDILTSDDKDDVPKLARLCDSVPEPDVHVYLEGVRQGGTLVTVNATGNNVAKAAEIMVGYHMVNIPARVEELRKTRLHADHRPAGRSADRLPVRLRNRHAHY